MEQSLSTLPYLKDILVAQLPFEHAYGSFMLGLVVRICPPKPTSNSEKTKKASSTDVAGYMRRLQAALALTFLKFENKLPLAARVLGPDEKMVWKREDLRDVFPYHVDPGFRADYEIGVHRNWMN